MANDSWSTPPEIYAALDDEFDFCSDMAASEDNAKHHIFWSEGNVFHDGSPADSLSIDWAEELSEELGRYVWVNPPYSNIGPFVAKAIEAQRNGLGVVMLVMADPSVAWFADAAAAATEIRFITRGRLAFYENGRPRSGNNKGSVLFIFAPRLIGNPKVTFVDRDVLMNRGRALLTVRRAA